LDDWTVQLQTLLRNSEKRIAELDDWTVELQTVLGNSENRISELGKLIEELESDLLQANKQSEDAKLQIEDAKLQNEELRLKLETTENVVAAMEASKFWKLRNHWFKLKDSLPTNSKQT
jgi:chromosome segregation ATPase